MEEGNTVRVQWGGEHCEGTVRTSELLRPPEMSSCGERGY